MLRPTLQNSNFTRDYKSLAPGICKILYLPVESMVADPVVTNDDGMIETLPALAVLWNNANAERGSMEYNESETETDAGAVLDIVVSCMLPYEEKMNHRRLNLMLFQRYIVIVYTTTGMIKLLGSKDNPVKVVQTHKSGKRRDGNSTATNISFVWRTATKPLQILPTVVINTAP